MTDGPPAEIEAREERIATAGGRLFAKTWTPRSPGADGRAPILLFHDSLGCVALWRGFPQRLAAATGRQVIAYDRLGFGRSDSHPGRLDFDFVSLEARQTVPQLLAHLGVAAFVACGHSVGGGMAVETAARFPQTCRALVTLAAQAFVEDRTLQGIRAAQHDFRDAAALARLARYHGDKARWVVDAWVETWLAPAFADWSLDAALATVRCPVLALHGEADEYGSDAHPRRIAAGRGTANILAEAGHVPHREHETLVVEIIQRFLAERAES